MISSEVEEIVEGSDRAYVMRDGRTVAELSGDGLEEHGVLAVMAHGTDGANGEVADV
jgi:ribose transport system ATP-binding protein